MGWYLIELPDDALTPYVRETEDGLLHGWGEMPKREIDIDELLDLADFLEGVEFESMELARERDFYVAERIRKAVGE